MQIIKNPDGTVTIQIPRGDESYDPATGSLVSEHTVSAKEWEASSKVVTGRALSYRKPRVDASKLPASLRDLATLGDSEEDVSEEPDALPLLR